MRIVCLGLGKRGRNWVTWAREAGADVAGVVDLHRPTLDSVGEELGISKDRRFTSLEEAVKALGVSAVVACAPNAAHAAIIENCLNLGVHVLIEKPFTEDLAVARDLAERASSAGVHVVIAQQYRYGAPFRRMADLAQSRLGRITGGSVQFYRWRPSVGLKLPILLNQGVHQFDCLRFALGEDPESCIAELWNPDWNVCDGPTVAEAIFRFPSGARVHYTGNYAAKGKVTSFDGVWRFEGEHGQVTYDGVQRVAFHASPDESEEFVEAAGRSSAQVDLCKDFLQSVAGGPPAPTHAQDNLKTMAMAFAIEASSRLKREVSLAEVLVGEV